MIKFSFKFIILSLALLFMVCFASAYVPFDCAKALKTIFKNEGGFSTDKNDPGNYCMHQGKRVFLGTKKGIAASVYGPSLLKQGKTIKGLTDTEIATLYERDYANQLHLSDIRSQYLATCFLDTGVNCGTGTTAILICRTINVLNGKSEDFPVDPYITKAETNWINNYTATRFYESEKDTSRRQLFASVFKEMRARQYVKIVRHKPVMLRYLPTWLDRTYE